MVLTRSQKAALAKKSEQSCDSTTNHNNNNSVNDNSIDSKQIANNNKKSQSISYLFLLCFWKPSNSTWTLWACIISYILNGVIAYDAWIKLQSLKSSTDAIAADIHLIWCLVIVDIVDITVNVINEVYNKYDVEKLLLSSESSSNFLIFWLFAFVIGCGRDPIKISSAVLVLSVTLYLQLKQWNNKLQYEKYLRILVYVPLYLGGCFASNIAIESTVSNYYVMSYLALIFISMCCDLCDFPDFYYDNLHLCEAFVIASRALAVYMLSQGRLLQL
jgi:hypothetical protein